MGSFWVRVARSKWRGGSVEDVKCCSRKVETGGRTSKVWGSMISAGQILESLGLVGWGWLVVVCAGGLRAGGLELVGRGLHLRVGT